MRYTIDGRKSPPTRVPRTRGADREFRGVARKMREAVVDARAPERTERRRVGRKPVVRVRGRVQAGQRQRERPLEADVVRAAVQGREELDGQEAARLVVRAHEPVECYEYAGPKEESVPRTTRRGRRGRRPSYARNTAVILVVKKLNKNLNKYKNPTARHDVRVHCD